MISIGVAKKVAAVTLIAASAAGCITVQTKQDPNNEDLRWKVVKVGGCNNPSLSSLFAEKIDPKTGRTKSFKEIKSAAGPDLCNTAVGAAIHAAGAVGAAAVLPGGGDTILNSVAGARAGASSDSTSGAKSF